MSDVLTALDLEAVSVYFPLLSCKGGCFGLFMSFNSFCLIGWRRCFFELLSGTSVPHHRPLTAGKPLVIASQPAPPECASCKGAFKGGRHGCQRRVFRPWESLNFPVGQVLQIPGFRFTGHLTGCLTGRLTGSLGAILYGMRSGNHL